MCVWICVFIYMLMHINMWIHVCMKIPERQLTKREWKIKQSHSRRRFTHGDWDKYQDEDSGDFYYYNHVTEEWQYEQPEDYVEDEDEGVY